MGHTPIQLATQIFGALAGLALVVALVVVAALFVRPVERRAFVLLLVCAGTHLFSLIAFQVGLPVLGMLLPWSGTTVEHFLDIQQLFIFATSLVTDAGQVCLFLALVALARAAARRQPA